MPEADSEKQAYWRSVLRRQQESGLSVRRFCLNHQLSQGAYYSWKRRIADRDSQMESDSERNGQQRSSASDTTKRSEGAAVFLPVRLGAAAVSVLEVLHPRGYVVRVPTIFDEDSLRQVLKVLDGQGDR